MFSKIFVLEAENFALSDEVTLAPCFGKNLNHSMVFEVVIELQLCQKSFESIFGEFG